MKRCPTCDKTFDDNLKFCQIDGTALVDEAPVDPYKTMVASKDEIAAAMSSLSPAAEEPKAPDEPMLDIPSAADANVTQVVSEAEMRAEMEKLDAADNQVIDVPPISLEPEPPKFTEPKLTPPSFGEPAPAPPPSPFSTGDQPSKPADEPFGKTSPPIPSPFGEPKPPSMEPSTPFKHEYSAPEEPPPPPTPQFVEPEPASIPFEQPAAQAAEPLAQAEWTAPAAEESNMQNPQNFGQNAAPAGGGQNQTLAIVSLVVGILSFCCSYLFIPGIAAIVLGFMARGKATNDPANYGGAGLALGGMICGAISLVLGVVVIILNVVFGFGAALMQGM